MVLRVCYSKCSSAVEQEFGKIHSTRLAARLSYTVYTVLFVSRGIKAPMLEKRHRTRRNSKFNFP